MATWKALCEDLLRETANEVILESSLELITERAKENTELKVRGAFLERGYAPSQELCEQVHIASNLVRLRMAELCELKVRGPTANVDASTRAPRAMRRLRWLRCARVHRCQAWKAARKSAEAALPARPDGYTCAESYALVGTEEHLVALVGEQYAELPPTDIFRVVDTKPKPSLVFHDPNHGYVFDGAAMDSALMTLLERVRAAVVAVDPNKFEEEGEEELDMKMLKRLDTLSSIAATIVVETSGQSQKPSIKSALIAHLRATPGRVIALDAQPGILNFAGPKLAIYDRAAGAPPVLVTRDPNQHHVHRSTGVDCAWLEETLSPELQSQYEAFESQKLCRWLPVQEVRDYFLRATGDALFGGDTTRIKSSLLLIGETDQAKSAQLDAVVAAGGWKNGGKKRVNTSGVYSYAGADPNALLSKDKMLRNAMYTTVDGTRLAKFNELESTAVWNGVKGLSNMETQSVTTKQQSSGNTFIDLVETPYAMLSCNKPPPPPPYGCEDKVAVITSDMLGSFVVDGTEDGVKTFKKLSEAELTRLCADDAVRRRPCSPIFRHSHRPLYVLHHAYACGCVVSIVPRASQGPMLRAMWLALKAHYAAHPGEPFDHEKHMPECMKEAREDPATWASGGGAGGSGGLSPEAEVAVVAELKERCRDKKVVILRDLIVVPRRPTATASVLSPACLLLLGTEQQVAQAKKLRSNIPQPLQAKLESCLLIAFPDSKVEHKAAWGTVQGLPRVSFTGRYAVLPVLP